MSVLTPVLRERALDAVARCSWAAWPSCSACTCSVTGLPAAVGDLVEVGRPRAGASPRSPPAARPA